MNPHPYLRAYLAGIALPSLLLLVALAAFLVARLVIGIPEPIETALIIPMAVVPNLWGLWNMIWVKVHQRHAWPIGLHGGVVPLFAIPGAIIAARALDVPFVAPAWGLLMIPVAFVLYYVVWKYIVGRLNMILGIA